MSNILFEKNYDSESICDVFRDVSEAFNPVFNEEASQLNEESVVRTTFAFKNADGEQALLDKKHYFETFNEVEEDITDSFKNLNVDKDKYGFFGGDLIVKMEIIA